MVWVHEFLDRCRVYRFLMSFPHHCEHYYFEIVSITVRMWNEQSSYSQLQHGDDLLVLTLRWPAKSIHQEHLASVDSYAGLLWKVLGGLH